MRSEHRDGWERVLKVRWNARCVDRVMRWLGLKCDFGGSLWRDSRRVGYKTAGLRNEHVWFHFPEYKF